MPTYEYLCKHCGKTVEEKREVDDRDAEKTCICGQSMVRIEIPHGGSFTLKGSGWFKDGY